MQMHLCPGITRSFGKRVRLCCVLGLDFWMFIKNYVGILPSTVSTPFYLTLVSAIHRQCKSGCYRTRPPLSRLPGSERSARTRRARRHEQVR